MPPLYSGFRLALLSLLFTSPVQAALIDRGNGLIYDSDLNITWLQDANYAFTSGYDLDGRMTWQQAMDWADQLEYGGFGDWRLPALFEADSACSFSSNFNGQTYSYGYNCAAGEMSHLFYEELGNIGYLSPEGEELTPGWGLANIGPFVNLATELFDYWSGVEMSSSSYPNTAWFFHFNDGNQVWTLKDREFYAIAVRDGDIVPIPLPASAWIFVSGLLAIVSLTRKKASHALCEGSA